MLTLGLSPSLMHLHLFRFFICTRSPSVPLPAQPVSGHISPCVESNPPTLVLLYSHLPTQFSASTLSGKPSAQLLLAASAELAPHMGKPTCKAHMCLHAGGPVQAHAHLEQVAHHPPVDMLDCQQQDDSQSYQLLRTQCQVLAHRHTSVHLQHQLLLDQNRCS